MTVHIECTFINNTNSANSNLNSSGNEVCVDWTEMSVKLIILINGFAGNIILCTVIACHKKMRTASNCYVLSLAISDFVFLTTLLLHVISVWLDVNLELKSKYVKYVTFEASILSISVFSVERYVATCGLAKAEIMSSFPRTLKSIFAIWLWSTLITAMELHLNEYYKSDTHVYIFLFSTIFFILFPTVVIVMCMTLIVIELREGGKPQSAKWKENEDSFRVLVAVTFGFYICLVPQRIVTVVRHVLPTLCCSERITYVGYLGMNLSAVVNPVLYCLASNKFRTAFKETMLRICCICRSSTQHSKEIGSAFIEEIG